MLPACRGLEQQIQDLNFQVSILLNQQQRSSAGAARSGTPQRLSSSGLDEDSTRIITANDAISQHLLAFKDVQVIF